MSLGEYLEIDFDFWNEKVFNLYSQDLFEKNGFADGNIFDDIVLECCIAVSPRRVLIEVVRRYLIPELTMELTVYEPNTCHNPIRAEAADGSQNPVLVPTFISVTGRQVLSVARQLH